MDHLSVQSTAKTTASEDQVWAVVRDFYSPWHPLVATMDREPHSTIRRFTVASEDTIYRERLTWFSDSERTMRYSIVDGIQGIDRYDAWLKVSPRDRGAEITLGAHLSASEPRASHIAQGTQEIFDLGCKAAAELACCAPVNARGPSPRTQNRKIQNTLVPGTPELAVSVCGTPGPVLCLFLHGIGGNRSNWKEQLSAMAPFCHVAALDLRGYGNSVLGPDPSTVDDYCNDILRVMQTLGAKRLILCGLSYGAWIATSFAMRLPDRLIGLVLSGGCTGLSEAKPAERDAFRAAREEPMRQGQTPAAFAPSVVDVIAGPEISADTRSELLRTMSAIPSATYADALQCFTAPPERFDFAQIRCPVLLMTGEYDRLAPPAEIMSVAERIWAARSSPFVRFEKIANAGHACNLECPDVYNTVLCDFLTPLC